MKKVLFFALMVAAVVGCKRSTDIDPNEGATGGQVIALSSGEVSIRRTGETTTTPVANQGTRVYFGLGDQIGVFAAYGKSATPLTEADWTSPGTEFAGVYIDNAPASCTTAGTESSPAKFTWGPAGEGGVLHEKLYPKKEKEIFVYSYYPLIPTTESATDITIDPTDGPKVSYVLNTTTPLEQPDILWSIGKSTATTPLAYVTRKDPLGLMQFEHALSQINFTLYKKTGGVQLCQLVDIKLTVPTSGKITLNKATDNIELQSESTGSDPITGTYTIAAGGSNIASKTVELWDGLDKANRPRPVLTVPYMIWPLTAEQAAKCTLVVRIFFGTGAPTDSDDHMRSYTIDMTRMKAILQGKLNHFLLEVTSEDIKLQGQITPWDEDNGNDSGLVIE